MWIVLLDKSGSMGSWFDNEYEPPGRIETVRADTKLEAAKKALLGHIANINPREQIVLCVFNGETNCLGAAYSASDPSRIQHDLADVEPSDGTDLAEALVFCRQFITTGSTSILIVSDGLTDHEEALRQAEYLAELRATIFFILIDPAIQTDMFARELTSRSGGFFWSVRSSEQLGDRLDEAQRASEKAAQGLVSDLNLACTYSTPSPDDAIAFTAGFPKEIQPFRWALLVCVVHLKKLADSVQMLLESQFSPEDEQPQVGMASVESSQSLSAGSVLRIIPTIPGISFFPRSYSIRWGGTLDAVHFRMRSDETCSRRPTGFVDFYANGIAVGRLCVDLNLLEEPDPSKFQLARENELEYVFLSYSRKDSEVIEKFETLWNGAGVNYFKDTESLRSGDRWRQKIVSAIQASSIFQLFWSKNASESQWVEREYKVALRYESERERFIRPVTWEQPALPLPCDLEHIQMSTVDLK